MLSEQTSLVHLCLGAAWLDSGILVSLKGPIISPPICCWQADFSMSAFSSAASMSCGLRAGEGTTSEVVPLQCIEMVCKPLAGAVELGTRTPGVCPCLCC